MNGIGAPAECTVRSVSNATLLTTIEQLTFLPCQHVLVPAFRKVRAWCGICYRDWREHDDIVYDPLLWSLDVVSACPVHNVRLAEVCVRCLRTQSPLGVHTLPGFCLHCGAPLTSSVSSSDLDLPSVREMWLARQVSDLLSISSVFDSTTIRHLFLDSLARLKNGAGGNVLALANSAQLSPSVAQSWLEGSSKPLLRCLLRTCEHLQIPVSTLFKREEHRVDPIAATVNARCVNPYRTREQLKLILNAELKREQPRSMSQVARAAGYARTDQLYKADPVACKKIAARFRESGLSHSWKKAGAARICSPEQIRELLERELHSDYPKSIYQISKDLGYSNSGYIRSRFPVLCQAIGVKRGARPKTKSLTSQIECALRTACEESPPPSLTQVADRLGLSSASVLRAHCPTLCDDLAASKQMFFKNYLHKYQRLLESALTEPQALSLRRICTRLSISTWFANTYFPGIARKIVERHSEQKELALELSRGTMEAQVLSAVKELEARGVTPSINNVLSGSILLSRRDWFEVGRAIKLARNWTGLPGRRKASGK